MAYPPQAALPNKRTVDELIPPSNDVNLFIDWLTELAESGLITLNTGKTNFVQTNIPIKFMFSETEPVLSGPEEIWFQLGGGANPDSGFFADRATTSCGTVPPIMINGSLTLTNGGLNAALAVNKETKSYTQIRFLLTGFTTAPTDLYAVVWGTDGSVLASTDSLASQATAAGVLITGTLKQPLNLSSGVKVYLGLVCIGGSGLTVGRLTYAGSAVGFALVQALNPTPVAVSMTGQGSVPSSGTPSNLSFTTRAASLVWMELI